MSHRPNILVFISDDHGQWASGCYGNSELRTPSMDHIARSGARMKNAFTPSPVCSPARASFFTGKMPSAHGIHDYLAMVGSPGGKHPALDGQGTLADALKAAGYTTGLVGKWHCGPFMESQGFDFWFTMGGPDTTNARFGEQPYVRGNQLEKKHGHQATHLTDECLRFLRENDQTSPFFLVAGYTNCHTPHSGEPARLVSSYRNASFRDIPQESLSDAHAAVRLRRPEDPAIFRQEMAQYYAAVSMIDEQIGRILDELDNLDLAKNTLIIYTSDHGHNNGHHGIWSKGNATIPQNFYEESIRVPCLLMWPGVIPEGQERSDMVNHCDLFATICDAAQAQTPAADAHAPRPGRSYLPLLRGENKLPWRDAQFCEYGNARMIRTARYKLVLRYPGPNGHFKNELYVLDNDPRETINRIDDPAFKKVRESLGHRLETFFQQNALAQNDGRKIADQHACNHYQPWSLDPLTIP
ncbi:MAG TPA: sulfatase-like hydrolase/transferase [Chthoniobacteraceae bacterium]|nr:sulfatase-like hydrolase/transferase [Chthoniobacteraceae bacterium]